MGMQILAEASAEGEKLGLAVLRENVKEFHPLTVGRLFQILDGPPLIIPANYQMMSLNQRALFTFA